jgi:hypothetical protein
MLGDIAGHSRADRRAEANGRSHHAEREIEMPGAARHVRDNERHHDADAGCGNSIQRLNDDEQDGIAHERK